MALGKKKAAGSKTTTTKKSATKLEELKTDQEVEKTEAELVDENEKVAVTEEKKEAPAEGKEVVVKKQGAALAPITGGKFNFIVDTFKDIVEPLEWGTIPKITAKQGMFFDNDKNSLGNELEFTLVSFNSSFRVDPNAGNDDKDAFKDHARYSHDNVTLNDGSGVTVAEYLAELKESYPRATVKEYFELLVILNDSIEENENIGNMVQLSLSPESVKQFKSYKMQSTVKVARKVITPEQVPEMTAKAKIINGDFTYTIFTFKNTHE